MCVHVYTVQEFQASKLWQLNSKDLQNPVQLVKILVTYQLQSLQEFLKQVFWGKHIQSHSLRTIVLLSCNLIKSLENKSSQTIKGA